jgi:hypothetical protein
MTEPLNKDQVQTLLDDSPYIGFMNLEVVSMDVDRRSYRHSGGLCLSYESRRRCANHKFQSGLSQTRDKHITNGYSHHKAVRKICCGGRH